MLVWLPSGAVCVYFTHSDSCACFRCTGRHHRGHRLGAVDCSATTGASSAGSPAAANSQKARRSPEAARGCPPGAGRCARQEASRCSCIWCSERQPRQRHSRRQRCHQQKPTSRSQGRQWAALAAQLKRPCRCGMAAPVTKAAAVCRMLLATLAVPD